MRKLMTASSLAVLLGVSGMAYAQTSTTPSAPGSSAGATAAMQMSAADCTTLWSQIDADKDGNAAVADNKNYVSTTQWTAADANKDGKLSKAEFDSACSTGKISKMSGSTGSSGAGTGSTGSAPSSAPSK